MKSEYEAGLWPGFMLVLLADAAAAVAAGLGVLDLRTARAGGSTFPWLLLALPLACVFVAAVALSGLYRPQPWLQSRRLASRAVVAVVILLAALFVIASAEIWPLRNPSPSFAIVAFLYVTFVAGLRLIIAAGSRGPLGSLVPGALYAPKAAGAAGFDEANVAHRVDGGEAGPVLQPATALPTVAATPAPRARAAAATGRDGFASMDLPDVALLRQRSGGQVDPETLPADWLDRAAIAGEGPAARACRRATDILGSLVLIVAVLPVLLLAALAIRLESRGPVFYRQERVGKDGRVFTLFKFRSMSVDAERDGPRWALPRDPRVTRVGRFMRLTRIDEVPQVINVLRGEMALIGPRPERPGFVDQLSAIIPHYQDRAAVKPGITGWAQVNYPYGASVEDARSKLAYDLYYIQHRSLAMDASIVVGTLRVVILQEGAR